MATLNVTIQEINGRKTPAELPDDQLVSEIIPIIITKMGLPSHQGGELIHYVLDHPASGKRLLGTETLSSTSVKNEDVLLLLGEPRAGE